MVDMGIHRHLAKWHQLVFGRRTVARVHPLQLFLEYGRGNYDRHSKSGESEIDADAAFREQFENAVDESVNRESEDRL